LIGEKAFKATLIDPMSQLNHDITFWIVGGSKTGSPSFDPKPYSTANYKGFNIFLHHGIHQISDTSSRIYNNQTLTEPYLDAAGVSAKRNVTRGRDRYSAP
jgi:hypothetical protein